MKLKSKSQPNKVTSLLNETLERDSTSSLQKISINENQKELGGYYVKKNITTRT